MEYNYRICEISELPSLSSEVHYHRGATAASLAGIVYALNAGVFSEKVRENWVYFTPIEEHHFTEEGMKFNTDVVILRTPKIIPVSLPVHFPNYRLKRDDDI